MNIEEAISRVSCRESATLNRAAQLMWERDCGAQIEPYIDDVMLATALLPGGSLVLPP